MKRGLLEDVITLKQGVFTELTAHELSEDRAANCFLLMCQDLSNQPLRRIDKFRLA